MRNYTITSIWGIPIRINVSLLVFLPILTWLIASGQQIEVYASVVDSLSPTTVDVSVLRSGQTPWVIGVGAALGLFASVAIHELGHAWMAMRYGIGVQSITLWILGGLASLERMPREWNQELWIALAGPVTSILTGLACYALLFVVPASLPAVVFVVGWLVVMNLTLAVFNMLPAFPMDGGRVLRAILARRGSYLSATRTAARVGTGFALLFAVLAVLSFSPLLFLLALFVYGAASGESRTVAMETLLEGVTVDDLASDGQEIDADATLTAFSDRMFRDRRTVYPVVDGGRIIGLVSLSDLRGVSPDDRDSTRVRDVYAADPPRLAATTTAFDGLMTLAQSRTDAALVETDGQATGVISTADISQLLDLRKQGVEASAHRPIR